MASKANLDHDIKKTSAERQMEAELYAAEKERVYIEKEFGCCGGPPAEYNGSEVQDMLNTSNSRVDI